MLKPRPEVYLGRQFSNGFTGHFAVLNYFGILTFEEGVDQDQGKQLIEQFKESLQNSDSHDLATFEKNVAQLIVRLNLPLHVGLAIGFLKDNIFYLKTVGSGQIFVRRQGVCKLLLSGDKVASGRLQNGDLFIFSNQTIGSVIGSQTDIQEFTKNLSGKEIIQKITEEAYGEEELGFVFFVLEFNNQDDFSSLDEHQVSKNSEELKPNIQEVLPNTPLNKISSEKISSIKNVLRDKRFVILVVLILGGILTWSVVFGYQRRAAVLIDQKIEKTAEEISAKLNTASDISESQLGEAKKNIDEAKNILNNLKKELGEETQVSKIRNIENNIIAVEESIIKKNSAEYEEFFDLALQKEGAEGSAWSLEGVEVAILDSNQATVYVLDLEKKSIEQFVSPLLESSTLISLFRNEVYFFNPEEGVFKFTAQNRTRSLIENDNDWGKINSLKVYNGNIFLLDSEKGDVYRYLVAEGGYSSKRSYFTSADKISKSSEAVDMAIDGSVYVLYKDLVEKYLSGVKQNFTPEFPQDNINLSKIAVGEDVDSDIFILDNTNNSVYVFSKDGLYKKSFNADIFDKNSQILSFENNLYLLNESKIFLIK